MSFFFKSFTNESVNSTVKITLQRYLKMALVFDKPKFHGYSASNPLLSEENVNLFDKTFNILMSNVSSYGKCTILENVKNISGKNIQNCTRLILSCDQKQITVNYILEIVDGKWFIHFIAHHGEKECNFIHQRMEKIGSVIDEILKTFKNFMTEIQSDV